MRITSNHAASSYGCPIILSDAGDPMDYGPGVEAVRARLGLTQEQIARLCGVSVRTVQQWPSGRRMPSAANLNVMADLLSLATANLPAMTDDNDATP